jgi:tryptophan 2,3-dioxygenase
MELSSNEASFQWREKHHTAVHRDFAPRFKIGHYAGGNYLTITLRKLMPLPL